MSICPDAHLQNFWEIGTGHLGYLFRVLGYFFPQKSICPKSPFTSLLDHLPQCPICFVARFPQCPFAASVYLCSKFPISPKCPLALVPICIFIHFPVFDFLKYSYIFPKYPFPHVCPKYSFLQRANLPHMSPFISVLIYSGALVRISCKCPLLQILHIPQTPICHSAHHFPQIPICLSAHFPQMSICPKCPLILGGYYRMLVKRFASSQSIVNIQIHTLQTKTSRLAIDYWLAPSLVLKLC